MQKTSDLLSNLNQYEAHIKKKEKIEEQIYFQRLRKTLQDESSVVRDSLKKDMDTITRFINQQTRTILSQEKRLKKLEKQINRLKSNQPEQFNKVLQELKFCERIQLISFASMVCLSLLMSFALHRMT